MMTRRTTPLTLAAVANDSKTLEFLLTKLGDADASPSHICLSRQPIRGEPPFILRRSSLRAMGFEIRVASVGAPDRDAARMTARKAPMDATYYVKNFGLARALSINLRTRRAPLAISRFASR